MLNRPLTDGLHARTLGRVVRTDPRCPPDTVAWHGLMAIWMAAMLAVPQAADADGAGLVVFGLGAAWAGLRLGLGAARTSPLLGPSGGAYLRTTVCCGAMVVMLLPGIVATGSGMSSAMPAMSAMPVGHGTDAMAVPTVTAGGPVLNAVAAAFVVLLSGIVVGRGILLLRGWAPGRRRAQVPARLAGMLELGTAAAMATMLGLAL